MPSKTKILIIGDSYSSNPVYDNDTDIKHGWTDCFDKHPRKFKIKNLSKPGGSFWRQVDSLLQQDFKNYRYYILFWSSPIRIYRRNNKKFVDDFLDPSPWSRKESITNMFSKVANDTRKLQKVYQSLYENKSLDFKNMEKLKAYFALSYIYNEIYSKHKDKTFINFQCFDWLEDMSMPNLKTSDNIYNGSTDLYSVCREEEEYKMLNHMDPVQHDIFSNIILKLIDDLETKKKRSKIIDIRKLAKS